MKPEDIKVGGRYEWRKDDELVSALKMFLDPGPFLITSIEDAEDIYGGSLECIDPSGRSHGFKLGIVECWQPFE